MTCAEICYCLVAHAPVVSQSLGAQQVQHAELLLSLGQVRAGHGAGKPTEKVIEEAADVYAFAAEVIGTSWVMRVPDEEEDDQTTNTGQRVL